MYISCLFFIKNLGFCFESSISKRSWYFNWNYYSIYYIDCSCWCTHLL